MDTSGEQYYGGISVNNQWSQLWNQGCVNLMLDRNIRRNTQEYFNYQKEDTSTCNCDKNILRCTLNKIPDTPSLLQKCRLPFGLLIHPFKDIEEVPIIQDRTIVRCRSCRTYINPYVRLIEQRRWQCNLCHRFNDLPDDFLFEPRSNGYLNYVTNQPELSYGTVEYLASVEYMVRPPQPAAYLFVFDCSAHAYHVGYINVMAKTILDCLHQIPGDGRTLIGFIGFDSKIHFFNLAENQPQHLIMPDIQDVFLPCNENLLVNLQSNYSIIEEFLSDTLLNCPFFDSPSNVDSGSALGAALTAAYKVISHIGGRVTVFQAALPNQGSLNDGSILANREDPNNRASTNLNNLKSLLNPVTDFYKKLALDFCERQVAVDLFNLCSTYSDIATIGQISKISGGSIYYYGSSSQLTVNPERVLNRFEADLRHYLCRNIGLEAVMRLRSTRGISIHTFHGNFFVRSPDLLALPNCNPDSGYAVQLSIDEDIKDFTSICFQAAVLYTTCNGERRIRVHTISLPVVSNVGDVIHSMDQDAVISLLAKMAVDRTLNSTLSDAREALINSSIDLLAAYKAIAPYEARNDLVISYSARFLPLFISSLLKHAAFRTGISTKVDERSFAMERLKSLPICHIINYIYPNLYMLHYDFKNEIGEYPRPVQLSFANIERNGIYLLDTFDCLYLYICKSVHPIWLKELFGVQKWHQIPDDGDNQYQNGSNNNSVNNNYNISGKQIRNGDDDMSASQTNETNSYKNSYSQFNGHSLNTSHNSFIVPLPKLDNPNSKRIHSFINYLIDSRPLKPHFYILREDSRLRNLFLQYMHDDRSESALSYYEFLQHLHQQMKN